MVPYCNQNNSNSYHTASYQSTIPIDTNLALPIARIPKSVPKECHPEMTQSWEPAVTIFENGGYFILEVELPGINPEFVGVDLSDRSLLIHNADPHISNESKSDKRPSKAHGKFTRSIALPALINQKEASARHENGILTLQLPKLSPSIPHEIKIRVEE